MFLMGKGLFFSEKDQIENVFTEHFKSILAPKGGTGSLWYDLSQANVHGKLSNVDIAALNKLVDMQEIANAIKFSNPNKSPGPDGFNSHFFKVCWPIIRKDAVAGILDFFKHGKLLRQIKNTFITLVPKKENATS